MSEDGCWRQDVVSALSDLKQGVEELRRSKTFKYVLATLLSIGNCLNNLPVSLLVTLSLCVCVCVCVHRAH